MLQARNACSCVDDTNRSLVTKSVGGKPYEGIRMHMLSSSITQLGRVQADATPARWTRHRLGVEDPQLRAHSIELFPLDRRHGKQVMEIAPTIRTRRIPLKPRVDAFAMDLTLASSAIRQRTCFQVWQ